MDIPASPAPPPGVNVAPLKPQAGFMDGTDGTPRMAWARYSVPMTFAFGNGLSFGSASPAAREGAVVGAVATDLSTQNPLVATMLDSLLTAAVGTGLTLSAKVDAKALGITDRQAAALNDVLETAWSNFWTNANEVDTTGRFAGDELATTAYLTALRTGEILAVFDWSRAPGGRWFSKVALLDPTQLDRSITGYRDGFNCVNGVAFDPKSGRLKGYYLRQLPMGSMNAPPTGTFVPAYTRWGRRKVLHIMEAKSPRDVRGLSPVVGGLTPSQERESLGEFTLANALLQTMFGVTVTSDLPAAAAFKALGVNDEMSGMSDFVGPRADWYSKAKINPAPGVVNHMFPGDKLNFNAVQNPSHTFEAFDRSLVRKAARGAGLSYEEASGDYSQTNFSAARLALELPHRLNMRRRKHYVIRFYAEVYRAFVEETVMRGLIEVPDAALPFHANPDAWTRAKWRGMGKASPDRSKEIQAIERELKLGYSTLEDVLAEKGVDLEQHIAALKAERALMSEAGFVHPYGPDSTVYAEEEEHEAGDQPPEPDEPGRYLPTPTHQPAKR